MTTIYRDWGKVVLPRGVPETTRLAWKRMPALPRLQAGVVVVVDSSGDFWKGEYPRQLALWEDVA